MGVQGDISFDVDNDIPFVQMVKAGARYADANRRSNTPATTGYVSEVWTDG